MSGTRSQEWRLGLAAILILHQKVLRSWLSGPDTCERRRLRIPSAALHDDGGQRTEDRSCRPPSHPPSSGPYGL